MGDILHVEVCQRRDSTLNREGLKVYLREEIASMHEIDTSNKILGKDCKSDVLKHHIEFIQCFCDRTEKTSLRVQDMEIHLHVYILEQGGAETEMMQEGDSDSDEISVATHWLLPSSEFNGLWDSLYFDSQIKENLVHFVETTVMFSERNVDPNIISWNRVVLLYGPPGTGKTSLCRALAQKITIRMSEQYTHGELVEINSHSLFSKWFSESGKLVMKMFSRIKELVENPRALVCVLIDEVESLAHARKSSMNGADPSDSIRVVNALLTQLDQIKRYPNVLVLTTSNVTEAIDLAFIDRADIKQYIGHPTETAIYKIYSSCLKELMKTEFIQPEEICDISYLKRIGFVDNSETKQSINLFTLSRSSVGLSGRVLRKIPFLAHAIFLQTSKCTLHQFIKAMHYAILQQQEDIIA